MKWCNQGRGWEVLKEEYEKYERNNKCKGNSTSNEGLSLAVHQNAWRHTCSSHMIVLNFNI